MRVPSFLDHRRIENVLEELFVVVMAWISRINVPEILRWNSRQIFLTVFSMAENRATHGEYFSTPSQQIAV
jgi:hypothetical protein